MRELMTGKRPALPSGMHPVQKPIVERGWKADPAKRPTTAEIRTELSEVDGLVFDGTDAERVKRGAAGLPFSQTVSEGVLQAPLSETQTHVWRLEREFATCSRKSLRSLP
jgi:hypothetical protein